MVRDIPAGPGSACLCPQVVDRLDGRRRRLRVVQLLAQLVEQPQHGGHVPDVSDVDVTGPGFAAGADVAADHRALDLEVLVLHDFLPLTTLTLPALALPTVAMLLEMTGPVMCTLLVVTCEACSMNSVTEMLLLSRNSPIVRSSRDSSTLM